MGVSFRICEAIKVQLQEISEVLIEVNKTTKVPAIQSEAKLLLKYERTCEFILSIVIWYDLLSAIDKVSKTLQKEKISINLALKNYFSLKDFLTSYCSSYENVKKEAFEICKKLEIESEFKKKRNIKKKKNLKKV